jgi:hypothetical protein
MCLKSYFGSEKADLSGNFKNASRGMALGWDSLHSGAEDDGYLLAHAKEAPPLGSRENLYLFHHGNNTSRQPCTRRQTLLRF